MRLARVGLFGCSLCIRGLLGDGDGSICGVGSICGFVAEGIGGVDVLLDPGDVLVEGRDLLIELGADGVHGAAGFLGGRLGACDGCVEGVVVVALVRPCICCGAEAGEGPAVREGRLDIAVVLGGLLIDIG